MFSEIVRKDAKRLVDEYGCDALQKLIDRIIDAIRMEHDSELRHLAEVKSAIDSGLDDISGSRGHE